MRLSIIINQNIMNGRQIGERFIKRVATVLLGSMLAATGFLSGFNVAQAAALTSTNVEPNSLYANATVNVTVTFTTTTSIPTDGKIKVTFPGGYNINSTSSAMCSTMDGGFIFNVSGQTVTLTRQSNGTIQTAAAESCSITGVVNPNSPGATGTYTIQTTNSSDVQLDVDAAVTSDTILANTLTSTNVQPASLVVNATSTATVTFTTASAIPANGKIKVSFPNSFNVSGVNSGSCSSMNGTFSFSVAGAQVTITRQNDGTSETAAAETCTIGGVTNPGFSGSTGTYTIQTTDASNAQIDIDAGVSADTITPGALTSTNVEPASLTTGVSSTVTVSFTTTNSIANNGSIKVTFPGGFNVNGVNGVTCSTMDGSFGFNFNGQTVNINRNGGSTQTPAAETCTMNGIVNPSSPGAGGTYTISTTAPGQQIVDTDAAVASDTFSAPVVTLTSTNVQPASLAAGANGNVTVTFTTSSSIPANGKIKVTFPNGFGVGGANTPACSSMDGTFTIAGSGQTVTITRQNNGTVQTAAAETCTFGGIVNPQISGATGTYTIQTTDASDVQIDIDSTVASDTITPGVLTSTNVEPASLVAGTTNTVTVSFTSANTIQNNGKIKVTFPGGFNVSGVNSATCSSMDGSFTFSFSGQTVSIVRNAGSPQPPAPETCTLGGIVNPSSAGAGGTYTIQTTNNTDVTVDSDTAVSSDTFTSSTGTLTSTNVQPSSLIVGATSTVTVTFTTVNTVPNDGKFGILFPAGFVLTSVPLTTSSMTCPAVSGTITTSVVGQLVVGTRSGGSSLGAGAVTCTIPLVRNPTTVGSGGTYTITTANSSNVAIDQDLAVAADTFRTSSSSSSSSTSSSSGSTATYTISVTSPTATVYTAGNSLDITWSVGGTGTMSAVNLAYSVDGGSNWIIIVTATANDGTYTWTVPSVVEPSVMVRAQGTDLVTVLATDNSDVFSIATASTATDDNGTDDGSTDSSGGTSVPVTLLPAGSFMKASSWNTVYYIDTTGARRPFLDAQTFFTYATSFAVVMDVEDSYLANYPIGEPMLPKAGAVLVKIQSVNKVYILGDNGELHWITSEALANALYGSDWASYVIDVPPTAWSHFTVGSDITTTADWSVDSSLLLRRDELTTR